MKKAISLLLVLVVALGMSSVAFASSDAPATFSMLDILDEPLATPGATQTYAVGAGEIFLVSGNTIVGSETALQPDETYKYDIYYSTGALTGQTLTQLLADPSIGKLTKTQVGTGTVRVRTIKGSSTLSSSKITSVGSGPASTYRLELETRANYSTKINDLEILLSVSNTNTANTFSDSTHLFTVGFNTISDTDTEVGEDGIITISNTNPVITKDQFTDIAKSANYKNVTFEADDGNWTFKGKVAGMKDTNFSFNYDPDTNLMNKFIDQEFKFVNFPGGVAFPTTGEMRIDVSDVSDDFKTMYAYLYRDGKLTEINTTYDSINDELLFRTNYLGNFIITNQAITDTSLVPDEEEYEEEEENIIVPQVPNNNTNNNNPATGASSANVAVAIGLITLASAAGISRKNKK